MPDATFIESLAKAKKKYSNPRASELTRWLNTHYFDIATNRRLKESWQPFLILAIKAGVPLTNDKEGLRRMRRAWAKIQARRKHANQDARPEAAKVIPTAPSRHTHPNWRPDYKVITPDQSTRENVVSPDVPAEVSLVTLEHEHPQEQALKDFSKKLSEVASLSSTVPVTRAGPISEGSDLRVGKERANEILRKLRARRKAQEPRFNQE